jgi:hypothetical protein
MTACCFWLGISASRTVPNSPKHQSKSILGQQVTLRLVCGCDYFIVEIQVPWLILIAWNDRMLLLTWHLSLPDCSKFSKTSIQVNFWSTSEFATRMRLWLFEIRNTSHMTDMNGLKWPHAASDLVFQPPGLFQILQNIKPSQFWVNKWLND